MTFGPSRVPCEFWNSVVLSGTEAWDDSAMCPLVALASGVHALVPAPAESGWPQGAHRIGQEWWRGSWGWEGPSWVSSSKGGHLLCHEDTQAALWRGHVGRTWGRTSQRSPGMVGRQWGAYPALISHLLRTGGPCSWAFVKGRGLTFQGSINGWRTIAYDLMACRLPTAAPLGSQPWSPQGEGETRTPGWAAVVTSSTSLSPRGTSCMFMEGCPGRHSSHLPCRPPVEGIQCPLHHHLRGLVLIWIGEKPKSAAQLELDSITQNSVTTSFEFFSCPAAKAQCWYWD